jgi:3-dehydroquinate dehydratase-2
LNILIINGPNINLIGKRETRIYGKLSYNEIMHECEKFSIDRGIRLDAFQSNSEGELVDRIQRVDFDFLIGNFGALTHYGYSIRDAILAVNKPFIEVHVSNIFKREDWRRQSVLSDISIGVITGFGWYSYILALQYICEVKANAYGKN